ncbi:ABC transporter ATP-binding protein [Aestuariimicrobium sp. p3-SID1156]|uniref:ABC transporter ATP-binding protein n=1 Tax=Aestuariimicrobium sp. p3-SID1156 TaxID=2916038 RepID=UPI002882FF66|nr:ABC transporter ATP-binding protein [Aestuariimicrobium sp. p3-SID1156]
MSTEPSSKPAPGVPQAATSVKANQRSKHEAIARKNAGPGTHGMAPVEKAANFMPSLKRLLARMRGERILIGIVVALAVFGVAGNVVGPKILGRATDQIVAGVVGKDLPAGVTKAQVIEQMRAAGRGDFADMLATMPVVPGQGIDQHALGRILLLALVLYVGAMLMTFLQGWILNEVVQRVVYGLRRDLSAKLDRLPLSYFDKQPRGELLSRMTNDIDNVAQTLQQTLQQILNALLMVVGVLIMMGSLSLWLTGATLLIVPLSGVAAALIGKRAQKEFQGMWAATGTLNQTIEESFTGHALVKVFGRQREVEQLFAERNRELRERSFRGQFLSSMMMPVMFLIGNLNYVVVAVVGGLQVARGRMPLGDVQAFIQYSRMFTQPITQLASMANLLQSGVASAERVFEVLDAEEMRPDSEGHLAPSRGRVEFRDVDFSYTPGRRLIRDLSLVAEPGQTIAIVGPTGAGKTTLVNLLMRFYELDGGEILLDGVDISSVPRAELRHRMGMVLQDTWLFGGTIRDNILYGRLDATQEEMLEAARATYVDRFVHSLPDGYDTVIDEEGSNISAGEKQLVTIARAFLANPSILILDEATSSVDTRTEVLVQQAMNTLREGRTSFVIAHRLSTIRDADLILVMEDGAIVEKGTHAELLASGGHYHDLYQAQFRAAAVEVAS